MTTDAFFFSISKVLVHSIAPLMSQPFLTDACIVPFIEKLVKRESKDGSKVVGKKKSATNLGNKDKLSVWLDLLWTFLDVGTKIKMEIILALFFLFVFNFFDSRKES